jgi:DHA2 family multidrug resistance protein
VGIAVLSTLLMVREQFHSARITEHLSLYNIATQQRLQEMISGFVSSGSDVTTATSRALAALDAGLRNQAEVMAYNDCFFLVALALVGSSFLVLLCDKVDFSKGGSGAH